MKKFVFIVFISLVFIFSASAKEISVKFSECVDGDTGKFIYKDEEIKARFLAVDTPETKHPTKGEEPFGKEASEYTCERLKSAEKIVLEFDEDSDEKDKYDRYLVWVFVDGELLQKELGTPLRRFRRITSATAPARTRRTTMSTAFMAVGFVV